MPLHVPEDGDEEFCNDQYPDLPQVLFGDTSLQALSQHMTPLLVQILLV